MNELNQGCEKTLGEKIITTFLTKHTKFNQKSHGHMTLDFRRI